MSRTVARRWELTGELVAESPVHVGNIDDAIKTDLRQARDGLDRPVLPGTALAGVIRHSLPESVRGDKVLNPLWGRLSKKNPRGADDGTGEGSWVCVDDAVAPPDTIPERRDTASIDRITGGPAQGHLFTREILPAGTKFEFRLTVDDKETSEDSPARRLVDEIAELLVGRGVEVGGATSRGLGRVRLTHTKLRLATLNTRLGMIATLRGDYANEDLSAEKTTTPPAGVVRITIPWRPLGPVMVAKSAEGTTLQVIPKTTAKYEHKTEQRYLVIPASSIKGVFRSHTERIVRTVWQERAPDRFLAQMRGIPVVESLFGTAADRARDRDRGRRGAVTVRECSSKVPLPARQWQAILTADLPESATTSEDRVDKDRLARRRTQQRIDELNASLSGKDLRFVANTHVAVDRWTGGAAEGLLFSVLEPQVTGDVWEPIVFDINVGRLDQADEALTLILLLLRDLCDGWIGFGAEITRGMGAVRVRAKDIKFEGPAGATRPWSSVHGRNLAELLDDHDLAETLLASWPPAQEENGSAAS